MATAAAGLMLLALSAAAAVPASPVLRNAAFPTTERFLGRPVDPLESLTAEAEDLRDSVAEQSTSSALQAGLRSSAVNTRLDAIRAAAVPREISAIPYLSGVMLRLDQPTQIRAAAALALGRIGDRIAVGALAEGLKDPAPEVRYAAALSLGKLPADGVATRLEKVLARDPVWQVRYAAAIALGRTRKAFVGPDLADALAQDGAWQVRQQAARSLLDIGTPRAAEALAAALRDPEPSVRAAAGSALAELGGPVSRRAVADALRDEREPSVRAVLAVASRRALIRL